MQPHRVVEGGVAPPVRRRPSFVRLALLILWPAFVMAGVLEMLVFVVVDPSSLQWFGIEPLQWSRHAVYSVTFFIFWIVIATSTAMSMLLESPGPAVESLHGVNRS
jgi:hypothetical protein